MKKKLSSLTRRVNFCWGRIGNSSSHACMVLIIFFQQEQLAKVESLFLSTRAQIIYYSSSPFPLAFSQKATRTHLSVSSKKCEEWMASSSSRKAHDRQSRIIAKLLVALTAHNRSLIRKNCEDFMKVDTLTLFGVQRWPLFVQQVQLLVRAVDFEQMAMWMRLGPNHFIWHQNCVSTVHYTKLTN